MIETAWVQLREYGFEVHRVDLLAGFLACASWVPESAGYRVPDDYPGQRCRHCYTKGDRDAQ